MTTFLTREYTIPSDDNPSSPLHGGENVPHQAIQPYGLDFSLEMVGDVPGQGRTCFAEANAGGRAAELSAYQAGATPGSPDFIVYRTNADRSLEVFLPNLGRESDGPWRHYVCSGLRPDAVQGFALDGCTDPIEIDP